MNKTEVCDYLKLREIKGYQEKGSFIFNKYGEVDKKQLRSIIEDMEKFSSVRPVKEAVITTSTMKVYSEDLLKELSFIIEQARRRIFGKNEAPFSSYDEAIEWIIDMQEPWFSSEDIVSKRNLFDEKFNDLCDQVATGELIGNTARQFKTLPYKIEELNGIKSLLCANFEHSKELRILQQESEFISTLYRLNQLDIVKLILSGETPNFTRYEIKKLQGARTSIVISINTSDLTFGDIKRIYDIYRQELNVKSRKRFSKRQEKLLNLIKERGERSDNMSFEEYYTKIQNEFNKRHPEEKKYETHQAVYKAWKGINEKLKEI